MTGFAIAGAGLVPTIVAAPAMRVMNAVAAAMGLLGIAGKQTAKRPSLKVEKHEKVGSWLKPESTLNVVSGYV